MRTQYITDDDGKKLAIILPIKEYNKMMVDLEELEEIKLYDVAKKGEQEFIAAEEAFKEIEKARNLISGPNTFPGQPTRGGEPPITLGPS